MYEQVNRRKEYRSGTANISMAQKEQHNEPRLGLEDNRSKTIAQRKLKDSMFTPVQPSQKNSPFQLVKHNLGNSYKLGKARYDLGVKKHNFKEWKRGREAQHLIPAAICAAYNIPEVLVNGAANGMMLPSGRKRTHDLRIKSLDKGKRAHIKKGWSHPYYNKYVADLVVKRGWKKGQVTKVQFLSLASFLRKKNRPKRTGATKGFVDDLYQQ